MVVVDMSYAEWTCGEVVQGELSAKYVQEEAGRKQAFIEVIAEMAK